ncbi:MAG: hypothetical protein CL792_04825 [Chloroflexi bacterium]|nr:hypothetical protein [Chloroflexota bacterium]|tara:strand:- start:145 stop:858 length:714 start_codon:yes stop_codon:yes gene_type:complete
MSKIKNLLRQTIQNASRRSIGFAHETNTIPNPQILIMAKANNKTEAQKLVQAGCNLTLAEKIYKFDVEENTVGIQIEAPTTKIINDAVDQNIDFIIFDYEQTPANVFGESEIGQILNLPDIDDEQLTTLKFMRNIDAVFVGALPEPFFIKDQLHFRNIAASLSAPLVALIENVPSVNDLLALRDSGILVLLTPNDPDLVAAVSKEILEMPLPKINTENNTFSPMIPTTGGTAEHHTH